MIYFFKGCAQVCLAPFKVCGEGCKCCEEFFKPILDSPLGCFVVLTWLAMLIDCICGALGLVSGGCGQIKIYSMGLIVFAVIHAVGAYYLQRRLVANLQKSGSTATGTALAKEAGRIFLYDVGFCIYMILFVASFIYGLFCMSQLTCTDLVATVDDPSPSSHSTFLMLGAVLMIFHTIGAFNYGLCWYFGNCCLGGMQQGGFKGQGGGAVQYPPQQGIAIGVAR